MPPALQLSALCFLPPATLAWHMGRWLGCAVLTFRLLTSWTAHQPRRPALHGPADRVDAGAIGCWMLYNIAILAHLVWAALQPDEVACVIGIVIGAAAAAHVDALRRRLAWRSLSTEPRAHTAELGTYWPVMKLFRTD
jgi:hypothetical protein